MSPESGNAAAIAERLQGEADEMLRAAEEILFNADGPYSFTPAQITVLRAAGLADRDLIEQELGRINSVRNHMATAGTESEFAAAEERLAAAVAEEKLLRPELEATVKAAEQKLGALLAELTTAQAAVDRRRQAREVLQSDNLLPKFAKEEIELNERCNCTDIRHEIAQLDARVTVIRAVSELEPSNAIHYCRNIDEQNRDLPGYFPLCEKKQTTYPEGLTSVSYKVIDSNFASHKRELLAELPEVEAQREAALAELKRRRDSMQSCRQWYVAQLGD